MRFGIFVPQLVADPVALLGLARTAERTGFETFWVFDHLYAPGAAEQPALEAWTTATALLCGTATLRVGALVLCNSFRHPALLGRMATTLDIISGGRLAFGLGSGSIEEEHRRVGLPWGSAAERAARLGETLEIVTRMFTGAPTTFAGAHYRVTELPNVPGPVQRPRPPIHLGGAGPKYTLPLVARYADVWNLPTYGLRDRPALTAALERECAAIDRDPATIARSHQAVLALAADEAALPAVRERAGRRYAAAAYGLEDGYVGTPAMVAEQLAERAAQGLDAVVFLVSPREAEATMELFAAEVLPRLAEFSPGR